MSEMRIRIARPDHHQRYWYADRVGEEFEVKGVREGRPSHFDVDISDLRRRGQLTVDKASVEFAHAIVLGGTKAGVCVCGNMATATIVVGGPFLPRPANRAILWNCESRVCAHHRTVATDVDEVPDWVKTKDVVVNGAIASDPFVLDYPTVPATGSDES
jgi:hypothetical protein